MDAQLFVLSSAVFMLTATGMLPALPKARSPAKTRRGERDRPPARRAAPDRAARPARLSVNRGAGSGDHGSPANAGGALRLRGDARGRVTSQMQRGDGSTGVPATGEGRCGRPVTGDES